MNGDIVSVLETLEIDDIDYYFEGSWRKLGACSGLPPKSFFPTRGADQEDLHKICEKCIVSEDCLAYAILANEDNGFWGNASERVRRRLRKSLKKKRPDLLKAGSELKQNRKKQTITRLQSVSKQSSDTVEDVVIDEHELIERLKPKVLDLLRHLNSSKRVEIESLMLQINVSSEAFWQRLNLAKQLGWVKVQNGHVSLSPAGLAALQSIRHAFASQPTIQLTTVEVTVKKASPGKLNELGVAVLSDLVNNGELNEQDGLTATQQLCERSAVASGPTLSACLKRLDDLGYIKRRVNGRRTTHLSVTTAGTKELLDTGSSGRKDPDENLGRASEEAADNSETSDEEIAVTEQVLLADLGLLVARIQHLVDANGGLRESCEELAVRVEALEVEKSEALAEIEQLRTKANLLDQMQQLFSAPS